MKRIRALRREPALRRSEGILVAEGIHLAEEALNSGADLELAVVSEQLEQRPGGPDLLGALADRGVPVHQTTRRHLDAAQDARSPQPILTLVRWRPRELDDLIQAAGDEALLVVIEGIQDPGNLGSIVRSADAAGVSGLVVGGDSADPTHPRSVRATAGSLFRMPLAQVEPLEALTSLRDRGYRSLGSAPSAAERYDKANWSGPLALVLGREGSGLSPETLEAVDGTVGIPMRAGVDSLSVGAAAAVLLFAAARRREP